MITEGETGAVQGTSEELAVLRGTISEIYILATSCVNVNASEETHSLAKSIVSRILSAGYVRRPSWFVHDWERALWEKREEKEKEG